MDAKAQKALYRSRLRETSLKREKRIDSPLARYNEDDQLVCRVCNVTLKSESMWPAHQASRKHHVAIENIKVAAAARRSTHGNSHLEKQENLQEPLVTSTLPADFFDRQDAKKQKAEHIKDSTGSDPSYLSVSKEVDQSKSSGNFVQSSKQMGDSDIMQIKAVLLESFPDKETDGDRNSSHKSQVSRDQKTDAVHLKQVKGALPAGFFDNKDADLRARGIEPVKVDIEDAYKEFEKDIQEDLQEVDDRLEEEEIDAAEVWEEIESLEQKTYRERVEMVKKKLIEAKESRLARLHKSPEFNGKDSGNDSSSDSDADEDFSVDWRAKRF